MNTPNTNSIEEENPLEWRKNLNKAARIALYGKRWAENTLPQGIIDVIDAAYVQGLDDKTRIAEASRREAYEEGKSHYLQEKWFGKVIDVVAYRREELELILKQARREAVEEEKNK